MIRLNKKSALLAFAALAITTFVAACDSPPEIDKTKDAKQGEVAAAQRKVFDTNKGNWDAVPQVDKDTFTKNAGGELNARAQWAAMGPGGPGAAQEIMRGGAPPTPAPTK